MATESQASSPLHDLSSQEQNLQRNSDLQGPNVYPIAAQMSFNSEEELGPTLKIGLKRVAAQD